MTKNYNIGEAIKTKRKELRYSLRELSKETGVSPTYLSQLERNERQTPSPDVLLSLSEKLGLPFTALLILSETDSEFKKTIDQYDLSDLSTSEIIKMCSRPITTEKIISVCSKVKHDKTELLLLAQFLYETLRSIEDYGEILHDEKMIEKSLNSLYKSENINEEVQKTLEYQIRVLISGFKGNHPLSVKEQNMRINSTVKFIQTLFSHTKLDEILKPDSVITYKGKELNIEEKNKIISILDTIL